MKGMGLNTPRTVVPPKRRQAIFVGTTPRRLGRCNTRMTTDMEQTTFAIPPKVLPKCNLNLSFTLDTVSMDSHTVGEGARAGLLQPQTTVQFVSSLLCSKCCDAKNPLYASHRPTLEWIQWLERAIMRPMKMATVRSIILFLVQDVVMFPYLRHHLTERSGRICEG